VGGTKDWAQRRKIGIGWTNERPPIPALHAISGPNNEKSPKFYIFTQATIRPCDHVKLQRAKKSSIIRPRNLEQKSIKSRCPPLLPSPPIDTLPSQQSPPQKCTLLKPTCDSNEPANNISSTDVKGNSTRHSLSLLRRHSYGSVLRTVNRRVT